ncbi:hypothetical protein PWT90_04623 [Aphanocladium album]|nr:hypothetical protein PWT90_04623 [Aphanocladium album]
MGSSADQAIDDLLERYLGLVDQYTKLRAELAAVQQSVFQHLARANFTSDRGVRYGRDQYDERMQASRRVAIARATETEAPTFAVTEEQQQQQQPVPEAVVETEEKPQDKSSEDAGDNPAPSPSPARNPIRWFGVLVPQALRDAQSQSVRAVEELIPRLVSVEAEMARAEIEVRRARKRRAKAISGGTRQEATNEPQSVSASS